MPYAIPDYVKIQTATIGSGAITLGEAVPGFRGVEGLLDGYSYDYSLQQADNAFEVGTGTYSAAGNTLVRGPIFSSAPGNAAIALTGYAEVTFTVLGSRIGAFGQPPSSAGPPAPPVEGWFIYWDTNDGLLKAISSSGTIRTLTDMA